jgi:hypothetical protein
MSSAGPRDVAQMRARQAALDQAALDQAAARRAQRAFLF